MANVTWHPLLVSFSDQKRKYCKTVAQLGFIVFSVVVCKPFIKTSIIAAIKKNMIIGNEINRFVMFKAL